MRLAQLDVVSQDHYHLQSARQGFSLPLPILELLSSHEIGIYCKEETNWINRSIEDLEASFLYSRSQADVDSIFIFLITKVDSARKFLSIVDALDESSFIVITEYDLLYNKDIFPGKLLGDYCVMLLGEKNGIDKNCPYNGFAPMLLDNIGCKVASVMCHKR